MKINYIQNFDHINQKNLIDKKLGKNKLSVTNPSKNFLNSYPIGYIPHQINFTSGVYSRLPEIIQLKNLKNLPCIYCGKPMIPNTVCDSLKFENNKVPRTIKEFVNALLPSYKTLNQDGSKIFKTALELVNITPNEKVDKMLSEFSETMEISNFIKRHAYKNMNTKEYTNKIIEILSPYEEAMLPVEKIIFREIKVANSNGETKKSLQDIMNKLRPATAEILTKKNINILTEIETIADKELSGDSRRQVFCLTQKAKENLISNKTALAKFKRKDLISALKRIKGNENEANSFEKIRHTAESIPTSSEDIGAFVVKYSDKNRSNEEIAQRLISPSVASVEHIKTQDSFKGREKRKRIVDKTNYVKKDSINNLSLAHCRCNSDRSNYSLSKYLKDYPEMKKHIQDYVDFVKNAINNGELKNMTNYPQQLKIAYESESKGALNIKI